MLSITYMAALTAEKTALMYQSQVTVILKPSQLLPLTILIVTKQPYHELVAAMTQCQSYFRINQYILHVNQMYQKVV